MQHLIARKIIVEELIICRRSSERFAGIDVQLARQQLIADNGWHYDVLEFSVSCRSDRHWNYLKQEWEENDFGKAPNFNRDVHFAKRDTSQVVYGRKFWFDISDVFDRDATSNGQKPA